MVRISAIARGDRAALRGVAEGVGTKRVLADFDACGASNKGQGKDAQLRAAVSLATSPGLTRVQCAAKRLARRFGVTVALGKAAVGPPSAYSPLYFEMWKFLRALE
jgi:hypothetical protein